MHNLLRAIHKHAQSTPDKTALVFEGRSLSYADLDRASARMAAFLRQRGLLSGSIVPVLLPRGIDALVTALGILKAGSACTIIDINYPKERIDYILEDTGNVTPIDEAAFSTFSSYEGEEGETDINLSAQDPAMVVYTSGSTGRPKGVVNSWHALNLALETVICNRTKEDIFLSTLSFSFIGITVDTLLPLYLGATLHIASDELRQDASKLLQYSRQHDITTAFLPPQLLAHVLEQTDVPMRTLLTGSEKVSMIHSDSIQIYSLYGASETCGPFTVFPIDKPYVSTPCGLPGSGSTIYILDEGGKSLPPGETGEICVSGQIASGYLNLPELTREKFISNPFAGDEGEDKLFCTGDLGYLREDGVLEYVQRKDWMLKIRGFRVEPGEIEAAIVHRSRARQAVVIGYTNAAGLESLYAAYTADQPLDPKEVEEAIRDFLPDYMLPSFMEQVEDLPLNENGKINRKAVVVPSREDLNNRYEPPANEEEERLCVAFAQVLGLKRVGVLDDFVKLGGDSISAQQLQSLLPQIEVARVLTLRTPRALAASADEIQELVSAPDRTNWPLTEAENQMVAEYELHPGSVAYNIADTISLKGNIEADRWERALSDLVERHRILRSSYPVENGEYTHIIHPEMPVELLRIACPPSAVEDQIRSLNQPFDLAKGPLFRFTLFETGPDKAVLLLEFHHIVLDGSCIGILLKDLEDFYNEKSLAKAGPDLFDWAVWRKENPLGSEGEQFFREMFKDGLPENDMPTHPIRPDVLPIPDRTVQWELAAGPVDEAARHYGVTTYTLLMAVIGMVVGKYTASEDIVLGAAMSGRATANSQSIVGMFANTLAVRLKPEGSLLFNQYLAKVADLLDQVKQHQDYPMHELVKILEVERNPSRNPVYDVLVNYISHLPLIRLDGVEAVYQHRASQRLPVDLQLEIFRNGDRLRFELSYAEGLYLSQIPENMAEQLTISLERVSACEKIILADAAELPQSQRRCLLEDFVGAENNSGKGVTIVDQFRERARLMPDRPAVRALDTLLDYKSLDDITDRLACELARRGIGSGDCVGVLVDRNEMMPIGGLGVLKSGAAYLPLDPSYPADRLEFMLEDADAKLVIADEDLCGSIPDYGGEFLFSSELSSLPGGELPLGPDQEDLFVLLYTSGTTGKPKGVCLHHDNLTHFCAWYRRYFEVTETDNIAAYASFGFDASLMDLYPALTAGAQVHIIPQNMRLDIDEIQRYFLEHGVSIAFMTTQLGRQFAEGRDQPSLRHLLTGGETLVPLDPPEGYTLNNLYGPTEGTIIASAFPVNRRYDRIPIGKPIDNTRIYVLDRNNRLAPIGVTGELCIAGRGVARGYLGRPELTEEKFVSNPFSEETDYNRIYRSGDLVRYLPDGNVDFVGRRDFQVKIRGFRVELGEIEARIRAFDGVLDATVLAGDAPAGGKCAVAYVVMDGPLDLAALNSFIEEKLPLYMVPAATVEVEQIPLNPNGKVDRKKLPAPNFDANIVPLTVDVQTDLGKEIGQVIKELLGYDNLAASTNLLQLGLASLGAIKLCSLLKNRFGVAPNVQQLLANPTPIFIENSIVRQLLERTDEAEAGVGREQAAVNASDGYPLSGSQMGVYLDSQKNPDALAYNIPSRLVLSSELDPEKLAKAVQTVIEAHPGIRVRIGDTADGIRQFPLEDPVIVEQLDLDTEEMEAGELEEYAKAFLRPFDLAVGPLYRVAVVRCPDCVVLLSDFHHIVFDGASLDLFLRQVGEVYSGSVPEPEQMSGHIYGQWELSQEAAGAWEGHKEYFDGLLRDIQAASELVPDLLGKNGGNLAKAEAALNHKEAEDLCNRYGLTMAGLFLAASSYCVGRWTGGGPVSLSTISSGRSDIRLQNSFGMFVRTLPLVVEMDSDQSVLEYIRAAQDSLHASLAHEAYPYTRIAEEYGFMPSIMYACDLGVLNDYMIAGQSVRVEEMGRQEAKFKVSIHVEERGAEIIYSVHYNDALYSAEMMENFAKSLVVCCRQMLENPRAKMKGISLLADSQAALIKSFQPADLKPLPCALLHGMFEQAADRTPHATALMACEAQYSYAQLDAEANRIANALLDRGLESEDRVAFILPRTGRVLMTMLGILKAGGAYVPLDPEYPSARVDQILDDCQAKFLIISKEWQGDNPIALDMDQLRTHANDRRPNISVEPHQLAYILYTSGSTGKPKGVMIEHGSIANYLTPAPENIHIYALVQDASCMMSITTVTFDMFLKESMAALCNGLKLVFAGTDAALDPVRLAELFEETGADAFNTTPSRMMEYTSYPALLAAIQHCRVVMAGAEKYPPQLMERLWGDQKQGMRLFNTYGPTETTVSCNAKELTETDRVTIGGPLLGVVECVMDSDGNELPVGIVGELWIGGRGVARGYVKLPEQTADRFVMRNGIRMYRSGDLARWTKDGEIELLGRNDRQVKLRGLRIELGEVEAALLAVAGVKNAAVIIRNVQGSERLCAYYTADRPIAAPQLQTEMARTLSPYMMPGAWLQLDSFPQTSSGKIDYRKLPDPNPLRLCEYAPPVNLLEERLAAIFAQVLELDPSEVGAEDSFFDIGGTSLSVTRLVIALQEDDLKTLGGDTLSYGDVFAKPTPRALAALLALPKEQESLSSSAQDYDYSSIDSLLKGNTLTAFRQGRPQQLGNVLLSGATGFLGIHILKELLDQPGTDKIFCLMRRGRQKSSEERLKQQLFYYFEDSYAKLFGERIFPLEGDITQPESFAPLKGVGLNTVINCAANVAHFSKDDSIFQINTTGVEKLIELCLTTGARLIQVSTGSVAGFSVDGKPDSSKRLTEQDLYLGQSMANKYVYSKFLAERALLAACANKGLDGKIMRAGNLMARNSDGEFQMNAASNSFLGRLMAYRVIGCFPYSASLASAGMAPVDSTAQAVLLLSGTPEACRVFQLYNDHSILMGDIITVMRDEGIPIEFVEDEIYEKELVATLNDPARVEYLTSLIAYQGITKGKTTAPVLLDSSYTSQVLLRLGWRWPIIDNDYIRKFIRDLISLGFFDRLELV